MIENICYRYRRKRVKVFNIKWMEKLIKFEYFYREIGRVLYK